MFYSPLLGKLTTSLGIVLAVSGQAQTDWNLAATGIDSNGIPIPEMTSTWVYNIVSSPTGGVPPNSPSHIVDSSGWPFPHWRANTTASQWIAPHPSYKSYRTTGITDPQGVHVFRTMFDLSSLDFSKYGFLLRLHIIADNSLPDVLLNGISTGIKIPFVPGNFSEFQGPFDILEGFISGTNILDFAVSNNFSSLAGNPVGLRVEYEARIIEILGDISVSEPGTKVNIGSAVFYERTSSAESIYQLFGRDSPVDFNWYEIGGPVLGTGDTIYGFKRGAGTDWFPSRAWDISENTDGYGLQFDGTDDFAFRAHDSLLNLPSGMTLEAWVKPGASGTVGTIIAKAASPSIASYRLGMNATGQATFQVFESSGTPFVDLTGGITLTKDTWTHLAATYDGSIGKLLFNGILDVSAPATGSVRISSLSPLVIGGILGSDTFGGLIDEVRIWDHARTEGSILANYATKLDGNEAGLVAYWQLQEPGSQVALDTTANGLDLTLGDTGNPESFDPAWFAESFPRGAVFQEIFEFGTKWFSVFWETQAGETYSLESAMDLTTGSWSTVLDNVQGTGGEVEYFEPPLGNPGFPDTRYYRVLGPPGSPPGSNVTQGLIGHFPLDTNGNDASGNGHHGTPQGGVTFVNDSERGQVASFDGIDGYIDYGDVDDYEVLDRSMTYSVWIKTSYSGSQRKQVFAMMNPSPNYDGLSLMLRPNDGCSPDALAFNVSYNWSANESVDANALQRTNNGAWHHICCMIDRDEETAKLYIDGVLDVAETGCSWLPALDTTGYGSSDSGSIPFLIGDRGNLGRYWDGEIDEFRIYDRALSPAEVVAIYNFQN